MADDCDDDVSLAVFLLLDFFWLAVVEKETRNDVSPSLETFPDRQADSQPDIQIDRQTDEGSQALTLSIADHLYGSSF
jgi:hypothetical protein